VSPDIASAIEVASRTLVFTNTYTWRITKGAAIEAGVVSYRIDRCKFKYEINFNHGLDASPSLKGAPPKKNRRSASH
jgi:hypothetical protein